MDNAMRLSVSRRALASGAVLGATAAFALAVGVIGALAPDARLAGCGGANPANQVRAAFEMSQAREFWAHFPSAPRLAPELNVDTPVFVVVFDGPVAVTGLGGVNDSSGLQTATLTNVVCVLMPPSALYPDGEPLIYYDVPLEGFRH